MTTTITTPNRAQVAARSRAGREALTGFLSTASAETPVGRRVRDLCGELADIERDRELADRYVDAGDWFTDLAQEERDVWEHIVDALTPHSKETK